MAHSTADRLDGLLPDRKTALRYAVVLNTELLVVLLYMLATGGSPTLFSLYGLIWVNVGAWALWRTSPSPTNARQRRIAAVVGVAYFAALALIQGVVAPGPELAARLGLDAAAPVDAAVYATGASATLRGPVGFVPALNYTGAYVDVSLVPTFVVGYAGLAYLVYATVVDAARASVSGVLGLLSCVSCTWPLIASLAAGVTGGSASALSSTVSSLGFGVSTMVFVATVALLHWRPFGKS
jgi:hypothetical protein